MSFENEHIKPPGSPGITTGNSIPLPGYQFYQLARKEGSAIIENRHSREKEGAAELLYELVSPEGIHFWHYRTTNATERTFVVENSQPYVQIVFSVYNNSTFLLEDATSFAVFGNFEYNLLFVPAYKTTIQWLPTGKRELFILNLLPELFFQYFNDHSIVLEPDTLSRFTLPFRINENNHPLTPVIRTILYDILNCPLEQNYKRLYLKAKVFELMAVLLSQQEQFASEQPQSIAGLRQTDVEKMQLAREILHENITNPCSLIDLAHQVGTNENYLKKHFKQVFGNTVYGYIQELRMQQAKQLLMSNEKTIQEVAQLSGYKHIQHFIVAFKKHFGYAPQ